ncbi:MAG: bifunctional tetrahydrofolate synthase/dihydrofolate synthase [Hydrogenophilales bacterium]|nr:bifunctional tetrahydrofolate synthase/dihydrofolate synthase [Hydrogenophilales bacterium]
MNPTRLEDWLSHLERLHPKTIELGLDRARAVKERLKLVPTFPVILVGGTNGKGSTCAMLEAMLLAAGYRVGLYTSPHLIRYNERVRIDGRMASDAALCQAFEAVEAARNDTALTYFEFGTLAAMWQFAQAKIEVAILEVGLGGRLDAVNVFEPDVAIVTTVDLDHVDYLGDTREKIGFEKAGIYRPGKPAICADTDPPASLLHYAAQAGAPLLRINQDFNAVREAASWTYSGPGGVRPALPYPLMRGAHQLANAAAAIAALDCLRERLPLAQTHIRTGLLSARLPGRFQVLPGKPPVILDVAHNPQAARILSENLRAQYVPGKTLAVFGMLRDKDIAAVITAVKDGMDEWYVGGLEGPRGASGEALALLLGDAGITAIYTCPGIAQAYAAACRQAGENDRICAFGSFYTVAEVLQARGAKD